MGGVCVSERERERDGERAIQVIVWVWISSDSFTVRSEFKFIIKDLKAIKTNTMSLETNL